MKRGEEYGGEGRQHELITREKTGETRVDMGKELIRDKKGRKVTRGEG